MSTGKPRMLNAEFSPVMLLPTSVTAGSYLKRSLAVAARRSLPSSVVTTLVENGVSTCLRLPSAPALTRSGEAAWLSRAALTLTVGSALVLSVCVLSCASAWALSCAQPDVESVVSVTPALTNSAALSCARRARGAHERKRTVSRREKRAAAGLCMFFW
jgi:hypothetical protein